MHHSSPRKEPKGGAAVNDCFASLAPPPMAGIVCCQTILVAQTSWAAQAGAASELSTIATSEPTTTTTTPIATSAAAAATCNEVRFKADPTRQDDADPRLACRCDAKTCDSGLKFEWPTEPGRFLRVSSSRAGARFVQSQLEAPSRRSLHANDGASLEPEEQKNHSLSEQAPKQQHEQVDKNKNIEQQQQHQQRETARPQRGESAATAAGTGSGNANFSPLRIRVKINEHFQRVTGFGGALTDSAAALIDGLAEPIRKRLLEDYFGPEGLDYNLLRIPIGGTDMSSRPYTYDDLPPGQTDYELLQFALQEEDLRLKIPLIHRVNSMREERHLPHLQLLASCWSPPAWLKDNQHLVQGNLAEFDQGDAENLLATNPNYATYASYIIRFMREYEQRNLTLWALSAQNEPRSPRRIGPKVIHHNSVNLTPHQLAAFYKYHLLPQLERAGYGNRRPLHQFVWEDVVDDMDEYIDALLDEPTIRDNITGVAMHWYSQGIRDIPFSEIRRVFADLPFRYSMISTEASYLGGQRPGDWSHGAGYAKDIIRTLNTGFIGWIDWNLALDPWGGPTWAKNPLDSAVQVDLIQQSYIKNPMFYALGHVVRFVPAGSIIVNSRLEQSSSTTSRFNTTTTTTTEHDDLTAGIHVLAAEVPSLATSNATTTAARRQQQLLTRRISLVILNSTNSTRSVRLELPDCNLKKDFANLQLELLPHSLDSFAFIC